MNKWKKPLLSVITVSLLLSCSSTQKISSEPISEMNKKAFFEKREALIIKHSHHDSTFETLKAQVNKDDDESSEYWRWRIDQYLYGQYPEYQPIYNAFKQGKAFNEIYALPDENLSAKKAMSSTMPKIPEGYFTDNLPGNPHTGWHDLIDDKVYIVYQGHLTDPYIASYDLNSQKWEGPYKAGNSTLSKNGRKIDSHGRPILEQDSKGHFHVVFGGHGGEREDGLNPLSIDTPHAGGRMLHTVSEKPNDISSFVEKYDISPFASYTSSHKMGNGDIYFFTRAGTHKSPWLLYKMKNGSQTFESPITLTLATPQKGNPINVDTHYINPQKISDTEIAISYLWHECNFLEVHNKENYGRLNAYYMKLDTTDDSFYNAKDEKLTLPITIGASKDLTLAYDSEKHNEISFGTKPLALEDARPALAYEARGKDYREWRMAVFDNGKWAHSQPMPGTENRTVHDSENNKVAKLLKLEVLGAGDKVNTAVVTYKDKQGKSVFATARRDNITSNSWRVEKEHLSVAKSKISMELVKNSSGDAAAVIVNVRKGAAQRLYLWQDGEFRANHK